ncbi:MAG: HindVP family restriction endonuclease [Candidatus Electrothrix sp. AR3]|nr:HindVP family restriction endonuclease [Candidatus Electrothrix sp. AR3]
MSARKGFMPVKELPGLFGLSKTNRNFSKKESWGKNQFNSSFPAALCCYLASKNIDANYLSIQDGKYSIGAIKIKDVLGISANSEELYFAFEAQHTPFQKYVVGTLPRTDVVIQKESSGKCTALEVKLTALPDNTTCKLEEYFYGSEIVIRPDTIVYLACSLARNLNAGIHSHLFKLKIDDWTDASQVLPCIKEIITDIEHISLSVEKYQTSFLLQPIWKTKGKSPVLAEQCLDLFVWSNAGFCNFISQIANRNPYANKINRQTRTAVWLYKMLQDFKKHGKFDHEDVFDNLSYNTRNDKAFSSSGKITNKYMTTERLKEPIISKSEIKNIILGGGQNMLSPERRFDAIIFNSPELFK